MIVEGVRTEAELFEGPPNRLGAWGSKDEEEEASEELVLGIKGGPPRRLAPLVVLVVEEVDACPVLVLVDARLPKGSKISSIPLDAVAAAVVIGF